MTSARDSNGVTETPTGTLTAVSSHWDHSARHSPTSPARRCYSRREAEARSALSKPSGDAEDPSALEGVGEDLQPADLVIVAITPNVHHGQTL
jgi:hypothetical protein